MYRTYTQCGPNKECSGSRQRSRPSMSKLSSSSYTLQLLSNNLSHTLGRTEHKVLKLQQTRTTSIQYLYNSIQLLDTIKDNVLKLLLGRITMTL